MCARIARLRCPRCGEGALFRTFFERADKCGKCKWVYEREQGFWVGGSEVHMFASYGVSVVLFMPLLILLGSAPMVQLGVIVGHVLCSVFLFRYSRAIFIGFDYFLDPGELAGDDDGGAGGATVPRKPTPRRTRSRPEREPVEV